MACAIVLWWNSLLISLGPPRGAQAIFQQVATLGPVYETSVKISVVEIYMEQVHDLLVPQGQWADPALKARRAGLVSPILYAFGQVHQLFCPRRLVSVGLPPCVVLLVLRLLP